VATAALLSAVKSKKERLQDQRFVIFGQGQAGIGIARQILTGLKEKGLPEEEARNLIFGIDKDGLLVEGMTVGEEQRAWLKPHALVSDWKVADLTKISLLETVRNAKASVLIGVTGQTGAFSEEILHELSQNTDVPVVLPLSNPTSKSECTAEEAFRFTKGKCICATGSPFPPILLGEEKRFASQCNNLFVFPGMGLGALVSGTSIITDQMFMDASRAISDMMTPEDLKKGKVLPSITDVRLVSAKVALAVAKAARDAGLGLRADDEHLQAMILNAMWDPKYLPYRYVKPELPF
jgi:malate dehydrogenase (oxaloacetate-decarboxylating)